MSRFSRLQWFEAIRWRRFSRSILRLSPLGVITAVAWVTQEFYPLSSFPMYSSFDDRTYLTYLQSPDGEPLATVTSVNMVSSQLKKRYGDGLEELDEQYKGSHFDWSAGQKRPAGLATIDYLRNVHAPAAFEGGELDGVRLIDVRLFLEEGKLVRQEEPIAEVR